MELLKGKITADQWRSIGAVIPLLEADISDYRLKYAEKVNYTEVSTDKSLYSLFLESWFEFYRDNNSGINPKFTGADGSALKQIITYLKELTAADDEALATWQIILNGWKNLNPFHQKNCHLPYINSKLNLIIQELKQYGQSSNIQGADDIVNQHYR